MEHTTQNSKYTFFLSTHKTFTKIDHILGHKTSLNKFKRTEIIQSKFSDHKGLSQKTKIRRYLEKPPNTWKLSNSLLNKL